MRRPLAGAPDRLLQGALVLWVLLGAWWLFVQSGAPEPSAKAPEPVVVQLVSGAEG